MERALPRRLAALRSGVDGSAFLELIGPIMTEEEGEVPGVPIALPVLEISFDTIVEMESRSCWLLLI